MENWIERNRKYTLIDAGSQFSIDFAGMKFTPADLDELAPKFERAAREMGRIEAGEIKNPDEHRKVTHFTDRRDYAKSALFRSVEEFAEKVRTGKITGETGKKFDAVVVNGIGGSALGPQLMQFSISIRICPRIRSGYCAGSKGYCVVAGFLKRFLITRPANVNILVFFILLLLSA